MNSLGSNGGECSLEEAYLVVIASVKERSPEDDLVAQARSWAAWIRLRGHGLIGDQFDRDVLRWSGCRGSRPRPPHVVVGSMARTCMSAN